MDFSDTGSCVKPDGSCVRNGYEKGSGSGCGGRDLNMNGVRLQLKKDQIWRKRAFIWL